MSAPHSVIFLGTSDFAVPSLHALAINPNIKLELVITQPDRPVGRKQVLSPPPVKVEATKLGLTIFQPESLNADHTILEKLSPDFLVVVSYGQILSEKILKIPIIAAVNVHASLLPKLRGASPIQHAILQGMSETGVTVQKMVRALDAGAILSQKSVMLDPRETYKTLHDKLASTGAELLCQTLLLALGDRAQDENEVTMCKKLVKADGIADPKTMTAVTIDRMVRALTPWPSVTVSGLKLLETSLEPMKGGMPMPCAENTTLYAVVVQPSGGTPMSGEDFAHGRRK